MASGVYVPGISRLNITIWLTTALIFGVIAAIFAVVLWASGLGGSLGVGAWLFFSLLMLGVQWYIGPGIIIWASKAKEVDEREQPELHRMVGELAKLAGVPKPKVYIVPNASPNAFAFGRSQSSSGLAVHTGILKQLDKEELRAVLAHEIGHIKHRDVSVMTVASVLPIVLYYAFIMFGSGDRRERGAGSFILVWLGAMLAQFLGQLLVLWLSRTRESYADAFSAYATEEPGSLMNALAKISYSISSAPQKDASPTLRAFYIADPSGSEARSISEIAQAVSVGSDAALEKAIANERRRGAFELLMTHPPTWKRLEALLKIKREMGG